MIILSKSANADDLKYSTFYNPVCPMKWNETYSIHYAEVFVWSIFMYHSGQLLFYGDPVVAQDFIHLESWAAQAILLRSSSSPLQRTGRDSSTRGRLNYQCDEPKWKTRCNISGLFSHAFGNLKDPECAVDEVDVWNIPLVSWKNLARQFVMARAVSLTKTVPRRCGAPFALLAIWQ